MGSNNRISKFSKRNRLLLTILIVSIVVVFAFLATLLYINYYARVNVILTTITRYRDGDIKNISEFDVITIKKGRNVNTFPTPRFEGYSFGGWYFDKDCTDPYDFDLILDEDWQIYGKMDLLEYSIELILDEGLKVVNNVTQNFDYSSDYTIEDILKLPRAEDSIQLNNNEEITIADYKLLHKEGYTFEGWSFSSTSTTPIGFNYRMSAQNLTFYAIWKPIEIELKYCTVNLSFAHNNPQSNFVENRINMNNGGVMYNTYYSIYVSESLPYGTKIQSVIDPIDEHANFVFTGWYMDPEFTVPVKFAQLYIKNGYFTISKESTTNVLKDPGYFDNQSVISDSDFNRIMLNSSTDESNSYINLYAKWELKKYTVRYHLNLPETDAYVDTSLMGDIVNPGTPQQVHYDNGNNLKENNNVFQGKLLNSSYLRNGVMYENDYFNDVVYIRNDLTGLPLYSLAGWNSKKDGSGYDATHSGDIYFDKSQFDIGDDDVINVYAQWFSYHRVNFYLTSGVSGDSILLSTINVDDSTIYMPSLISLVADITDRKVTFTEQQQLMNEFALGAGQDYLTPLNKTFVGWVNDYGYVSSSDLLYIENIPYKIGVDVDRENGIYLSDAVKNLYTAWIDNVNCYSYDLGEDGIEKTDFSKNIISLGLQSSIITNDNGTPKYRTYTYDKTRADVTLLTIYEEEFLITKYEGDELYSLNGWVLNDGSRIEGNSQLEIKFDKTNRFLRFITNSVPNELEFRNVTTGVYFDGLVTVDNGYYSTEYNSNEDRSYIVVKARNVMHLTFNAVWVKNIVLTYDPGVDDVEWTDGASADSLTNTAGGNVYMQLSDPTGKMNRPYYRFYGWSSVNREANGEVINFNTFVAENTIYNPRERYDLLTEDTIFYAVWEPVVYTLNVFQQSASSPTNSSTARFYMSKECFVYNRNEITSTVNIEGNILTYLDVDGSTDFITITTSAIAGYGLSAWSNVSGEYIVKNDGKYTISPIDDVNNLFEKYPATNYSNVNIYPLFEILKYDVVFNLSGEGINESVIPESEVVFNDVLYGTNIRNLVPRVYNNYYEDGYKFKGWNISGDVDNRGNIKQDYIVDINKSNIQIKSDLVITLIASKLEYTVKFVFQTPEGEIKEIKNYTLNYYDQLSVLSEEIQNELNNNEYIGYNFNYWQTSLGGITTNLYADEFEDIHISTPLELYAKYKKAKVHVKLNYESDGEQFVVERESEYMSNISLNTSGVAKQPSKDGYILKGWALSPTAQDKYFKINDSLALTAANVGNALVRPNGADYYELNLYAKWVESLTLSFDTSRVNIQFVDFPTVLHYEKGAIVYFKDIPYLPSLSNDTIKQNNGLGYYVGVWSDQKGKEYNVTTSSGFIVIDSNMVLTPKFNPKDFSITYNYEYMGQFFTINDITTTVNEQYGTPPSLLNKSAIDTKLSSIANLSNYRAKEYYLTKSAYQSQDANLKFELGAQFDFVNNADYLAKVENDRFEFYIQLQGVTTLTYYSDRNASNVITTFKFDKGLTHIIGDTNNDGILDSNDIEPSKNGYIFKGWNSSLEVDYVEFTTGVEMITGTINHLYPVWEACSITLEYLDEDGSYLGGRDDLDTDSVINALKNFDRPGSELSGWATTQGGEVVFAHRSRLELKDASEYLSNEYGIYYLRLYAKWETAKYCISFQTFTVSGVENMWYGKADGTLTSTFTEVVYNTTDIVSYNLPSTADSFVSEGKTYRFTGEWTDGVGRYTTTTGGMNFTKDVTFTPIYNQINILTFMHGSTEVFRFEINNGGVFAFNNTQLLNATSDVNESIKSSGVKIIAYANGGNTYTSASTLVVQSNIVFTAVTTNIINYVVYRDLVYDGSTFAFENGDYHYEVEMSSTVNLANYATTIEDCSNVGFVVSLDANYTYSPSASGLVSGNYALNRSNANAGATIYFYPVIETTVYYYANGSLSGSEVLKFGQYPTKTNIQGDDANYFTGWKVGSLSGADYVLAPVSGMLSLHTVAKPYLQVVVSDLGGYIKNYDRLYVDGKKSTDSFSLSEIGTVELNEPNRYVLSGWYIAYLNEYSMSSGVRKIYGVNETICLQDVLDNINPPDTTEVNFTLTPVIGYVLHTLTIKESENISYNVDVAITTAGMSTTDKEQYMDDFIVENSGYEFYVLDGSHITITNDDKISFEAYLKENGKVKYFNYRPVVATIVVSKTITTGYVSERWYYVGTNNVVATGTEVDEDLQIQAQTATAEDIVLSVNLIYNDLTQEIPITADNIASYKDNCFYIESDSYYAHTINTNFGQYINFVVVIKDGYEFVELRDSSGVISANVTALANNKYKFIHVVTTDDQLYVVIKRVQYFAPTIRINTDSITNYDSSKIDSISKMNIKYKDASGWVNLLKNGSEFNVNWEEFKDGYEYVNKVALDSEIQVFTHLNSYYYYVDTINVYNDGTTSNADGGNNSIRNNEITLGVKVTGVLVVELVLKERLYSISYYDGSNTLVNGDTTAVTETIGVNLVSVSKTGYTLDGFKVMSGINTSNTSQVGYITENTSYDIDDLYVNVADRNYSNQQIYIVLYPTWINNQHTVTLESDYGYFLLNNVAIDSVIISVPYDEIMTLTTTESDGIITENELTFVTRNYSVDSNGNLSSVASNNKIKFVPYGLWRFVDGYEYGTSGLFDTTYTISSDMKFAPRVEGADGTLTISIGNNMSGTYNNKDLQVGDVVVTADSNTTTSNLTYNSSGEIDELTHQFDVKDNVSLVLVLNSSFAFNNCRFIIDGKDSSDYDTFEEFVQDIVDLNVTIDSYGNITFNNLIYDVVVKYLFDRNDYNASIKVESATSGSDLEEIFEDLESQNIKIANISSSDIDTDIMVGSDTLIESGKMRAVKTYTLWFNYDYFEVDRIYYTDGANSYDLYNSSLSVGLSSFNPLNNQLSIVYGGDLGAEVHIVIVLRLRTFDIIFHGLTDVYSSTADYSEFDPSYITPNEMVGYNNGDRTTIVKSGLFRPNDFSYNGVVLKYVDWQYYDGNYEKDAENNAIDDSKMKSFDSFDWSFGYDTGNLHLFSQWNKIFKVNFLPVYDGIDAEQSNLPASMSNAILSSEINLTMPIRNGFSFRGYTYVYDSIAYFLRHNGATFTALEYEDGSAVDTITTFNVNDIRLSQLVTNTMARFAMSDTLNFEPIWERNGAVINIINDSDCGVVELYSYDGTTAVNEPFNVMYYYTLQVGEIEIDEIVYNCMYVKNGSSYIGAIVVKPNTSQYHVFKEFRIQSEVATGSHVIDSEMNLNVVYEYTEIPHTINLNWDAPYDSLKYILTNDSESAAIKVMTYDANGIAGMNQLDPKESVEYSTPYSKIVVYAMGLQEVKVVINFEGYHLSETVDVSEITLSIDGTANTSDTTREFTMSINRVSVDLTQVMSNDINTPSTDGGKYIVSYFAPIISGGLITGYSEELTSIEIDADNYILTDMIAGSVIYFEKVSDGYEIVQILNGNIDITDSDINSNNTYITLPDMVSETYDIKVVFDYEYALVNFEIAGRTYASAYFKTSVYDETSGGFEANPIMVASAYILINGYENFADKSAIFDDTSLLTGEPSSTVNSKIIKAINGIEKVYYTEGELITLFNKQINENIATYYYEVEDWKKIWVEEFDFASAYQPGNITINELFVGAGMDNVVFMASVVDAFTLSIESDLEVVENKVVNVVVSEATARGSIRIEGGGDYFVLGNSTIGYNGGYESLYLKVKENSTLPKLTPIYDTHTSSTMIDFSESVFGAGGLQPNAMGGYGYEYVHEFKVRQVSMRFETTDKDSSTNHSFEKDFSSAALNHVIMVNYATSFSQLKLEYSLQNQYSVGDDIYVLEGFYNADSKRLDDGHDTFEYYFEQLNTDYLSPIYIHAYYVKVESE